MTKVNIVYLKEKCASALPNGTFFNIKGDDHLYVKVTKHLDKRFYNHQSNCFDLTINEAASTNASDIVSRIYSSVDIITHG